MAFDFQQSLGHLIIETVMIQITVSFYDSDNDENDDAHENGDFCLDPTQVWRL